MIAHFITIHIWTIIDTQCHLLYHQALKALLQTTRIHFIRCIKPNEVKKPDVFNAPLVLNQLSFLGVMETVRIRKLGYPNRMEFESMAKRYRFLLTSEQNMELTPRQRVDALLAKYAPISDPVLRKETYQAGRTKMFMKQNVIDALNSHMALIMEDSSTIVAALINRAVARRRFKKMVRPPSRTVLFSFLLSLSHSLSLSHTYFVSFKLNSRIFIHTRIAMMIINHFFLDSNFWK